MKTTLLCVLCLTLGVLSGYKIGLAENDEMNRVNQRTIDLLLPEVEVTLPAVEAPVLKRLPPVETPKRPEPIYVENLCCDFWN